MAVDSATSERWAYEDAGLRRPIAPSCPVSTRALRNGADALVRDAVRAVEEGEWELVAALCESAAELAGGCQE